MAFHEATTGLTDTFIVIPISLPVSFFGSFDNLADIFPAVLYKRQNRLKQDSRIESCFSQFFNRPESLCGT